VIAISRLREEIAIRMVTVAGKLSQDIPPGTLNSILKQSGLRDSDRS
jgi:predicted RNA binding protein YcfA (HicA-like mRNA interferase family)